MQSYVGCSLTKMPQCSDPPFCRIGKVRVSVRIGENSLTHSLTLSLTHSITHSATRTLSHSYTFAEKIVRVLLAIASSSSSACTRLTDRSSKANESPKRPRREVQLA